MQDIEGLNCYAAHDTQHKELEMYAYHQVNTITGEQTEEMEMMTKETAAQANDELRRSGSLWRWALVENLRREVAQ